MRASKKALKALEKTGAHLETPQRWGILPTLAFWNRRDVSWSARWFTAPMGFVIVSGAVSASSWLPGGYWKAPVVGVFAMLVSTLAIGGLERVVRRGLEARLHGIDQGTPDQESERRT
jgi:hypothetical protein